MKTNIRLLVAIAAMLAAPALNAQSRSGHNPGGSTRPGHHTTVSGSSHSSSSSHKDAKPGNSAKPGKDAARPSNKSVDVRPSNKPAGHGAVAHNSVPSHNPGRPAHRPNPAYRPAHRPTPPAAYRPAHRPTPPPPAHRPTPPPPAHRPSVGYVFRPLAGVTYTLCRFAETIATISACNAIARAANTNYYYNDGCFYKERYDGRYEVVVPPAGAIVYSLPDYYETLTLNGVLYYKVYDTLYSLTVDASGTPAFLVVGQMNG